MYIYLLLLCIFSQVTFSVQATTSVTSCRVITASGHYTLTVDITATTSPCILIEGNNIEFFGNSYGITDPTGSRIGVQLKGSNHSLHDVHLIGFSVSVDVYSSNTEVQSIGIYGTTQVDKIGIRATGSTELEIAGIITNSEGLTSSQGKAIGFLFDDCDYFSARNFDLLVQSSQLSKGIQVLNSRNGYITSYSMMENCNPTGVEIIGSTNIKLYAGNNQAYGCSTDTTSVVGIYIDSSSDILLSKVNSINYKGKQDIIGLYLTSSKYIGLYKSNIEEMDNGISGTGSDTTIYVEDTIGFTSEASYLGSILLDSQESTGVYVTGNSQAGIHLSQLRTDAVGMYIADGSAAEFYANSIDANTSQLYHFENDRGLCANGALNEMGGDSCYPPSEDSCCNSACQKTAATCRQPQVLSVLGLPFDPAGSFITILGSDFGDNYYDTIVAFNDSLCLIHEKSDTVIICWLSGENLDGGSGDMYLSSGWHTYTPPIQAPVMCDDNSECPSNICHDGGCVDGSNHTIIPGEAINFVLDLGHGNTLTVNIDTTGFPAGYFVYALSHSVTDFYPDEGDNSRIVDFEFYILSPSGAAMTVYPASQVEFLFEGPDVSDLANLYVGANDAFVLTSSAGCSWSADDGLTCGVTAAGNGVFALMMPSPVINNITATPTNGGRITISGAHFGTSKELAVARLSGPSQSIFCPVHLPSAVLKSDTIECDLPEGVGSHLTFAITFFYPAGPVTATIQYAYHAPTISQVYPYRLLHESELPGLVITVVGTNFGEATAYKQPKASLFAPSLGGNDCKNVVFQIPHKQFSCELGFGGSKTFTLWVGDTAESYSQNATFDLRFANVSIFSCDESGIEQAIAAGGDVRFDCKTPTIVDYAKNVTLAALTQWDGNNNLSINARGSTFLVGSLMGLTNIQLVGVSIALATLESTITLQNVAMDSCGDSCIVAQAGGDINIRYSSFTNCSAASCFALLNATGVIESSTLQGEVGLSLRGIAPVTLNSVTISATRNSIALSQGATATLENSILFGSQIGCDANGDGNAGGSESISMRGTNFVGTLCNVQVLGTSPITTDPVLLPLQQVGGSRTYVFPISPNSIPPSPAVNVGDNLLAPSLDQLMQSRIISSTVDVGAFEFNPANSFIVLASSPSSPVRPCEPVQLTVSTLDQFGFSVRGYNAIVYLASSDSGAMLPNSTTLTDGEAVFTLSMFTPGTQYIYVSDNMPLPSTTKTLAASIIIEVLSDTNRTMCVVGCDGVVGSGLANDSCGVCGGNNTCRAPVGGGDDDDHNGAIIGGVIGGFFGLLFIAAAIVFAVHKHRAHQRPPPPDFVVTGAAPQNNVRFGIAALGSGWSPRFRRGQSPASPAVVSQGSSPGAPPSMAAEAPAQSPALGPPPSAPASP